MPDQGPCTFGVRMPIDIHMLNEYIAREVKHFKNYKIYRPNFGSTPVTGKFYAAHDQIAEEPEQLEKIEAYKQRVTQTRSQGPHCKYEEPVTANNEYGWYWMKTTQNTVDRRFFHPIYESPETKIEVIIEMSTRKQEKDRK